MAGRSSFVRTRPLHAPPSRDHDGVRGGRGELEVALGAVAVEVLRVVARAQADGRRAVPVGELVLQVVLLRAPAQERDEQRAPDGREARVRPQVDALARVRRAVEEAALALLGEVPEGRQGLSFIPDGRPPR